MATQRNLSLDPNFSEFIALLNSEGVEYLLIGGYAVNYHGYHRYTGDIDFWIKPEIANAIRAVGALTKFGFNDGTITPENLIQPNHVVMLGRQPYQIDLLSEPSGVEFDGCYERRITAVLDDVTVPIISLADLRRNKQASGRDKDLIDLKQLPEA